MAAEAISDTVSASVVVQLAAAQLATFFSLLLAVSAGHKLSSGARARHAAAALLGASPRGAALLVAAAAAAELSAGCLILVAAWRVAGAVLAAAIWGLYGAALALAFARGKRDVDCGCSFSGADRRLGAYQAVRAFTLAGLASLVALGGAGGAATAANTAAVRSLWTTQLLAAAAMLGLYVALDQLTALRPLRRGEVR